MKYEMGTGVASGIVNVYLSKGLVPARDFLKLRRILFRWDFKDEHTV